MKFAIVLCFLCYYNIVAVKSQFDFGGGFDSFGGFAKFGGGGGFDAPLQAARDPRQNPGPVVFPPAPPDNGETSGVIVGASGYGFVPPNSPRFRFPAFSFF